MLNARYELIYYIIIHASTMCYVIKAQITVTKNNSGLEQDGFHFSDKGSLKMILISNF